MIEFSNVGSFLLFCVIMSGTPGPNNTMALIAGIQSGIRGSIPLVFGIAIGVGLQLLVVGFGLAEVFALYPILHEILRVVGVAYLLWLAFRIAQSKPTMFDDEGTKPIGFWQGALFQWINTKAWITTTGAILTYIPAHNYNANIVIAALLLALVAVPCVGSWSACGSALRPAFSNPTRQKVFNVVAGLLLAASAIPILISTVI
ncbi:LysE family translocator [Allorhizobium undicola]|uniref:LysE family translocator n=1 Tax=Allorhizobium undicola TaxID=78527 RepID=UPI003D336F0D